MSGGGKGGATTQAQTGTTTGSVQIPAWLESAARQNMARADDLAQIGYVPYYGPDVAAFSPMQQAAFQNTGDAAAAFGLAAPSDPMAGMPQSQTFAGGVQGYSSMPLYQQSLDALAAARPGQFAALQAPFINPITGADPAAPFGSPQDTRRSRSSGGGGGGGGVSSSAATGSSGQVLRNPDGSIMTANDRLNAMMGRPYTPGGGITPGSGTGQQMGGSSGTGSFGLPNPFGGSAPRTGTGSFGLPDPMSGSFGGTNLPGFAGGIINSITRR